MAPTHKKADESAVILFAKTPHSSVKTRIAATHGRACAQRIYRQLLETTGRMLTGLPYHVAFAGSNDEESLTCYFPDAHSYFPQCDGDLGNRLIAACRHLESRGINRFCLIGTDCPHLTADDIVRTFAELADGRDVVIGPAEDGGYYCAGINEKGGVILQATKWSTPELLQETYAIVKTHSLALSVLPVKYDIDTMADYLRWKELAQSDSVPHTGGEQFV